MAAAAPTAPNNKPSGADNVQQTAINRLEPPKAAEMWSTWYHEQNDKFTDFQSYDTTSATAGGNALASGGSMRTLSARQISGQFEEEVAKSWEEDWEDEDVEDTFDQVMGYIGRYEASKAASSVKKSTS